MSSSAPSSLKTNTRVRVHHVRAAVTPGATLFLQQLVAAYIGLKGVIGESETIAGGHSPELLLVEFSKATGPYTCLLFYPDELEVVDATSQDQAT